MLYFYRRVAVILGLTDSHVTKKLGCLRAESNLLRFSRVTVKKSKTFTHVDGVFDLSRIPYITLQMSTTFSILNVYLHTRSISCNLKYQSPNQCARRGRIAIQPQCDPITHNAQHQRHTPIRFE